MQAFFAGTFIALSATLGNSLTANTVPPDQLARAVPLQALGLNVARVGGPALGGVLILLAGPAGAFGAYAVAAFTSLVAVSRIQPAPRPPLGHAAPRETLLQRVASGIRYARERPPALLALALVAATSILGASYPAILPVLAAVLDHASSQQTFIVLVSASGVGSFIVVINVARRSRSVRLQSMAAELLVLGILLPFVGLSGHVAVAVVLVAVCGGCRCRSSRRSTRSCSSS